MFVELDFRSHVPIYVQIVERIKHLVATEALKPGDQLPTVRQLAADLRVNFNTIARAYRILDEAGVISTQQGRGTYVLEPLPPERATRLRQAALDALVRSFLVEADRLGFEPDEVASDVQALIDRWRKEGVPPEDGE
ncbi:MAG: GntR family transcriptional regulator [Anaerolineaceae bacterium]|nr:MAG: GntR family transcriptional regulator [Anaerolineaceae bacterium]